MDPKDDCTGKGGIERSRDTGEHRRCGIHNGQCHVHVPRSFPQELFSALNLPTKQFQSVRSIAEPGAAGLTWGELVGSAEPLSDFRETNRPLSTSPLHTARESATNWTA